MTGKEWYGPTKKWYVTCTHNLDLKQCGYFFTNIMGTVHYVALFNGSIIFFTCHARGKFDGIYKIVFLCSFNPAGLLQRRLRSS